MSYQSFPYNGFRKGLNLRDKPDAVDQDECIDALNVSFSERGAIVTRGGYAKRVEETIKGLSSFQSSAGTKRLLTIVGNNLKAYSTGGSEIASSALTASPPEMSFARVGTPSNEYIYGSNGVDFRRFNGSAFSSPSSQPKALALCVQAADNRLVAAGFNGTSDGPASGQSSPSHIYFSDAGAPETWGANNFDQLTPGDGERIMNAVSWQEKVYAFKESKFFVFYGNSVDAGGDPVFNKTAIDTGVGLASRFGVTTAPDGVYFVASDGLYRTRGGAPERVSDRVEPLWSGERSGYYTGGVISDVTECRLTTFDGRIYMAFPTASGQRVLVFDPVAEWFTLFDLPAVYVHAFDGYLWFGDTFLAQHRANVQDDAGSDIRAWWRSGWVDFGNPDVKVLRGTKVWGAGTCFSAVAHDFSQDPGTKELLDFSSGEQPQWDEEQWNESTWAEPRGLEDKQRRRAVRGTTFSTLFEGSAPWAIHRIDHLVRQVRQPGVNE